MKMGVVTVKFIGKEYSIPTDVLRYMEFLSFTNNVKERLLNIFIRKIKSNIDIIEKKDFLEKEILDEANKFIAKLCENDIYGRTANDYIKNNKGYEFIHTVNAEALKNIIAIRSARNEVYKTGVQNAIYKKEASVTGLDFGIISNSLVSHAIYATMNASQEHKQEQAALKQYNKEIEDLRKNVLSNYEAQEQKYISSVYVEGIELGFTALTVEWLDKLLSDLVKNNKFDSNALKYIDLERSNDLLKNLNLAKNKTPILENAFLACPFNIAVYMNAMKYDLLDYETFQTAKYYKQSDTIISFLEENLGEIAFPTNFKIDYQCADLLALFTDKKPIDFLHAYTESYVKGVIKAYSRVADMISNKKLCYKIMSEQEPDLILAGDSVSKNVARSYLKIVTISVLDELTEKCGYQDLFDEIRDFVPKSVEIDVKDDVDNYLKEKLYEEFEVVRKELATEIKEKEAAQIAYERLPKTRLKEFWLKYNMLIVIGIVVLAIIIWLANGPKTVDSGDGWSHQVDDFNKLCEHCDNEEEKATHRIHHFFGNDYFCDECWESYGEDSFERLKEKD